MSDQQQRPPYPPAPPYPQQGGVPQPPRPTGVPPYPPGIKMPAGVKMPPRPMGYPMPAGVKMPPRPVGVPPMGMPPPGPVAVPQSPLSETQLPVPADTEIDEEWGEIDSVSEPDVDENGFIDDLEDDSPEPESEEEDSEPAGTGLYEDNMAADFGLPPVFVKTKLLLPLFLFFIVFGAALGYMGSMLQQKGGGEMPGVVRNMEIPKGRPRCGIAQKGQGCVLYIMNSQRREVEGRDFFTMAADILNIPKFQIETANIRYATMRIPPGYIALLNIPPVQ
ncbi:MAG: hypothetical protein IJ752_04160 [Alphaproteobacteria bacterium]|nr:hypothetical protein [Alphaproteobacteria bacterium]